MKTIPIVTKRRGQISGALLAFLASIAVLGVLIALLVWKPKRPLDKTPLTVYVAAGLKGPFEEIAAKYEEEFGVPIEPVYAASEQLILQMEKNGDADLFIPADYDFIEKANGRDLIDENIPLGTLNLVLAVRPGNPKGIKKLDDLLRKDVHVALAFPKAAVGKKTKEVLDKDGFYDKLTKKELLSFKPTVPEVATDLRFDTAHAAFLWDLTVAQSRGEFETVAIPEIAASSSVNVAVAKTCKSAPSALRFARYLAASDQGQKSFAKYGLHTIPDADAWADGEPQITIFAGAMLRPAAEETIAEFAEREGLPRENIHVIYDGCGLLVTKMEVGRERPDAFFACDATFLTKVKDLYLKDVTTVSTNQLVILVPKGNPHNITSLESLGKKGLKIGVGHENQCAMGALTQETLTRAGKKIRDPIVANVVDRLPTGDALVNKMLMSPGTYDAVIAYVTNARHAADKLEAIKIHIDCALATQPIAVGESSSHKHLMRRLIAALRSKESRERFEEIGFKWVEEPKR